jgi:lipid-binding SYLF domain-containing protein
MAVDGVVTEEKVAEGSGDKKKSRKVLRKIPPAVINDAKGLAIFTSMRSGIAPLGGAGGAGVVVAKLPDGSEWLAALCSLLLTPTPQHGQDPHPSHRTICPPG